MGSLRSAKWSLLYLLCSLFLALISRSSSSSSPEVKLVVSVFL